MVRAANEERREECHRLDLTVESPCKISSRLCLIPRRRAVEAFFFSQFVVALEAPPEMPFSDDDVSLARHGSDP